MGNQIRKIGFLAVIVLLFCMTPGAVAQNNTVSMKLTSPGSNVLGGIYVGPYTATINGVSTQVICDDFADESWVGDPPWTAYQNTLSPLTDAGGLKWGNNQLLYDQVAYLISEMMTSSNSATIGDLSYAIWQLTFCSQSTNPTSCLTSPLAGTPFAHLQAWGLTNDLTNAENMLSQIPTSFSPGVYPNFTIYTPISGGPPQEFITVPESPTLVMLGTDLLGLVALIVVMRRRRVHTAS